jgi:hypothetical protein
MSAVPNFLKCVLPFGIKEKTRLGKTCPQNAGLAEIPHRQRRGVFGESSAEAVSERWLQLQSELRLGFEKVSFVPDHVHVP